MKLKKTFIPYNAAGESLLVPVGNSGFDGIAKGNATLDAILHGTDLQQISDTILRRFEMPADQGSAAAAYRAKKAQEFLEQFGGHDPQPEPQPEPEPEDSEWDADVALIQVQMARDGFWPKDRIDGKKSPEFRAAYREWSDAVATS